jgi:membrane-bound metal-dependent hydrolase YbcI (DUF457 family)
MGPGLLIKSLLGGAFSLMIFGWCQILMDIQPLLVMITGLGHLHGFSHTFIGSTCVGIIAVVTGVPLANWFIFSKAIGFREEDKKLLGLNSKVGWLAATFSSLVGSYSHVVLDAIMHSDVRPHYPINLDNLYWNFVTVETLHSFCLYSGVVGLCVLIFARYINIKPSK